MGTVTSISTQRAKAVDLKSWHRPATRAIDHYITTLGEGEVERGRVRFLAALMLSTSDDPRVDELLQLVEDPTYKDYTLGHLAVATGFRAGELLRIVRDMELLVAQAKGIQIIGDNLAAVVSDVVDRSQRHYISCEQCNEVGQVWITPKKKGKLDPDPEPIQVSCSACNGKGKIVAEADPVRQQMVLEIAKLLPKAGGASIAIQQNLGVGAGGGGSSSGGGSVGGLFDKIIGATDAILKRVPGQPSAEDDSDADADADDGPDEASVQDETADVLEGVVDGDVAVVAVVESPADVGVDAEAASEIDRRSTNGGSAG